MNMSFSAAENGKTISFSRTSLRRRVSQTIDLIFVIHLFDDDASEHDRDDD